MGKSKNSLRDILVEERYLIWAIFFAVLVTTGLLTQISIAKMEIDTDISSTQNLVNIRKK